MGDVTKHKARKGIKPLCPVHQEEMSGPIDEAMEFYLCRRSGCEMCWRAVSEYFRFVREVPFRTIMQMQQQVHCSKVGHGHKFLARVNGDRGVWECSIEGCSETEEKPLAPKNHWDAPGPQKTSFAR
jgi:hypothetical protein